MLRKLMIALIGLTLLLAACAPAATPTPAPVVTEVPATLVPTLTEAPTPEPISLTDGLGRTVELAGPAQRIVSLIPRHHRDPVCSWSRCTGCGS